MDSNTITLSDVAYTMLKRRQRKGESFDDLILRLLSELEQKEILNLAGSWKGSKEETDEILKIIYNNRKNAKLPRSD